MADDKRTETGHWIRCNNRECLELVDSFELKQNGGKCPHCGKPIWITD